jgi:hypothetical protein
MRRRSCVLLAPILLIAMLLTGCEEGKSDGGGAVGSPGKGPAMVAPI